eukprot:TRINITY_DN1176_c5_g1_i1.p1 TRINITY_DN1176_c5_g1~~TRINITY_DN1176_c5_g1_i1.p1  ORF type:complete len:422 (+),score=112.74 TRINITY_DN1176_c5_g1_i1:45-1310(+)
MADVNMDTQSEASDMEEVIDMEQLEELQNQGMVKVMDENDAPVDDDSDDGEEADMPGDHTPDDANQDDEVVEMAAGILKGHKQPVHCVSVHPKLPIAASGGEDDQVYLWNVNTDQVAAKSGTEIKPTHHLQGHTDTVIAVSFSPDGATLATAGMDGKIILWEDNDQKVAEIEDLGDAITYLFWHPKGKVLFAGGADSQSGMWSEKGKCLQLFPGHAAEVTCGALVSDDKLLATGSDDQTIRIFAPKTGEQIAHFSNTGKGMHEVPPCEVTAIAPHPRNQDAVIGGYATGDLCVFGITSKRLLIVLPQVHQQAVESIQSCPIMPYFSTASSEGTLSVWNAENNSVRDSVKQEAGFIQVQWVSEHLYTADAGGEVRRYDGRQISGGPQQVWTGHSDVVLCMSAQEDGWVVSGSDDSTLRLFKP